MIVGSLLGTAIITGSLIVGDTINRSIRAAAYDQLGPIDELVSVPLPDGPRVTGRLQGLSAPSVDGVLTMTSMPAAVIRPGAAAGRSRVHSCSKSTSPHARPVRRRPDGDGHLGSHAGGGSGGGDDRPRGQARPARRLADPRLRRRRSRGAGRRPDPAASGYRRVLDDRRAPAVVQRLRRARAPSPGSPPRRRVRRTEPPQSIVAISNVGGVEDGAAATQPRWPRSTRRSRASRPVRDRSSAICSSVPTRPAIRSASSTSPSACSRSRPASCCSSTSSSCSPTNAARSSGCSGRWGCAVGRSSARLASEGWLYAVPASALGAALGIAFGWLIAWRADRILCVRARGQRPAPDVHVRLVHGADGIRRRLRHRHRHHRGVERADRPVQRDPSHPGHSRARPTPAAAARRLGRSGSGSARGGRHRRGLRRTRSVFSLMAGPMLVAVGAAPGSGAVLPGASRVHRCEHRRDRLGRGVLRCDRGARRHHRDPLVPAPRTHTRRRVGVPRDRVPRRDRCRPRAVDRQRALGSSRSRLPVGPAVPHRDDPGDVRGDRPDPRVHERDLVHEPRPHRCGCSQPVRWLRHRSAVESE